VKIASEQNSPPHSTLFELFKERLRNLQQPHSDLEVTLVGVVDCEHSHLNPIIIGGKLTTDSSGKPLLERLILKTRLNIHREGRARAVVVGVCSCSNEELKQLALIN